MICNFITAPVAKSWRPSRELFTCLYLKSSRKDRKGSARRLSPYKDTALKFYLFIIKLNLRRQILNLNTTPVAKPWRPSREQKRRTS
jgi:hypothetical protein